MTKERANYFKVRNFDKFQHYKDRNPPWIKLYKTILEDYEFAQLQDDSKMHLIGIFLLASCYDNRIRNDSKWIASRISANSDIDLDALSSAGFIVYLNDSVVIAERKQSAMPETETETEPEKEAEAEKEKAIAHKSQILNNDETNIFVSVLKTISGKKVPPSITDVESYFKDSYDETEEEALVFWRFYESKGWYVGKNKMVDWHMTAGNWMARKNKEDKKKNNSSFKLDSTGKFYIGYCSICRTSGFYDKWDLLQDSRCCQGEILNKKPDRVNN